MKHESYIAYIKSTRPTGKAMGRLLNIPFGILPPNLDFLDVLIRWGSRKPMPDAAIILNSRPAIANANDKIETFNLCRQAGVPCVPHYTAYDKAWYAAQRYSGVVFGRDRTGFGGKDIVIYNRDTPPPVKEHDFYTIWYDSPREVRIHVVGDKVVRVQGKYLDVPQDAEDENSHYIRNHAHGYRFRTPRQEIHSSRKKQAVAAIKALGLDFGAVDMLIWGGRDAMLLEVNSAPSCSPLTARCYAGELALKVQQYSGGDIRIAPAVLETEIEYDENEEE